MEELKIEILFSEKERSIYEQIRQNCKDDNISLQDYVKDLILTDLAWGRFSNSRKRKK